MGPPSQNVEEETVDFGPTVAPSGTSTLPKGQYRLPSATGLNWEVQGWQRGDLYNRLMMRPRALIRLDDLRRRNGSIRWMVPRLIGSQEELNVPTKIARIYRRYLLANARGNGAWSYRWFALLERVVRAGPDPAISLARH